MSPEKRAWWRGTKVRESGHSMEWYKFSLAAYSSTERAAFLAGYNAQWDTLLDPMPYERALRDCLIDCKAIIELVRSGGYRFEHEGQLRVLARDIALLQNREDCPNYDYRKGNNV